MTRPATSPPRTCASSGSSILTRPSSPPSTSPEDALVRVEDRDDARDAPPARLDRGHRAHHRRAASARASASTRATSTAACACSRPCGFVLRGRFTPELDRRMTSSATAASSPASTATRSTGCGGRSTRLGAGLHALPAALAAPAPDTKLAGKHGRAPGNRPPRRASRRPPAPGSASCSPRASATTAPPGSTSSAWPARSPGRG